MTETNVLVVEDETKLNELLGKELAQEFAVESLSSFGEIEDILSLSAFPYDILILDRMMDGKDTLTLIPLLKEKVPQCKILILSALNTPEEKANALNLGADDYLSKPFSFDELRARLRALERRVAHEIRFSNLTLNTITRNAFVNGQEISLSNKEFLFLQTLMRSPGRIFSKAFLFQHVWQISPEIDSNAIETTVNKLRRKLEEVSANLQVKNSRHLGYWIEE